MSARIELLGQGFTSQAVKIDRSFPGILADKMSNSAWLAFCDEVDTVLEPLTPMKQKVKRRLILTTVASIGLFAALAIMGATGSVITSSGVSPVFIGFFIACAVVPMAFQCSTMRTVMSQTTRIMENLQRVLNTESAKRSDVSFHIRTERYYTGNHRNSTGSNITTNYIECSVGSTVIPMGGGNSNYSNDAASTPVVAMPVFSSTFENLASAPPATAPYSNGRSVAERLQELEGIRSLISTEEYSSKKKAILDGI